MQRVVATLLLVLFSSSLIGQALVVDSDPDAKLPACCRRNGSHHCSANKPTAADQHENQSSLQSVRPRCTQYPASGVVPAGLAVLHAAPAVAFSAVSQPNAAQEAETHYRVSLSRAWQKRGPPARLS